MKPMGAPLPVPTLAPPLDASPLSNQKEPVMPTVLGSVTGAPTRPPRTPARFPTPAGLVTGVVAELFRREARLAWFGFALLALLVPLAFAAGLDDRALRGANVWSKPMKFALSLGLFALTTAWFVGHLLPAARRSVAVGRIVQVLIGSATFELAYITLQAGLGQGSHYNFGSLVHGVMYALMGVGAVALTATQPALAWLLLRHADPQRPEPYRLAVVLGLVLTFVLGTSAGGLLSAMQPPETATLPIVGWSLAGGDLRPAHFLGIHAQQALPLVGMLVAGWAPATAKRAVIVAAAAYALIFLAVSGWALAALR